MISFETFKEERDEYFDTIIMMQEAANINMDEEAKMRCSYNLLKYGFEKKDGVDTESVYKDSLKCVTELGCASVGGMVMKYIKEGKGIADIDKAISVAPPWIYLDIPYITSAVQVKSMSHTVCVPNQSASCAPERVLDLDLVAVKDVGSLIKICSQNSEAVAKSDKAGCNPDTTKMYWKISDGYIKAFDITVENSQMLVGSRSFGDVVLWPEEGRLLATVRLNEAAIKNNYFDVADIRRNAGATTRDILEKIRSVFKDEKYKEEIVYV